MKRLGLLSIVGLVGLGTFGCQETETSDSADIRTSGMYAAMDVVASGDGTTDVTVGLRVGGDDGNVVKLTDSDTLQVFDEETTRVLKESGDNYKTTFTHDTSGTKFTIKFVRGSDDDTAENSFVKLPEKIEIEGAGERQTVSRADGTLDLTWVPTDDSSATMSWDILDSDCLNAKNGEVGADKGKLTLSGDDFWATASATAAEDDPTNTDSSCTSVLCLSRNVDGTLDSAFGEGGYVKGVQRVCVKFISSP